MSEGLTVHRNPLPFRPGSLLSYTNQLGTVFAIVSSKDEKGYYNLFWSNRGWGTRDFSSLELEHMITTAYYLMEVF